MMATTKDCSSKRGFLFSLPCLHTHSPRRHRRFLPPPILPPVTGRPTFARRPHVFVDARARGRPRSSTSHALPFSGGDDGDNDFSPLLDLLQRFPDLFEKCVLERLDPFDRASLAQTGSAFQDAVYPRSIFPHGVPRAQTTGVVLPGGSVLLGTWGVVRRVFKLVEFLGTAERLAWAKANGCPWGSNTCELAAQEGNLIALQWIRAHGCHWNEWTTCAAARGGHLEVLRWAREHKCAWGWRACALAAQEGHLEVLQWARAHGCEWRKRTCECASRNHPETLAWVREQPDDTDDDDDDNDDDA